MSNIEMFGETVANFREKVRINQNVQSPNLVVKSQIEPIVEI